MRTSLNIVVSLSLLMSAGVEASGDAAVEGTPVGLMLKGQDAVDFLLTAEVTGKPEDFDDLAITSPRRMELTRGDLTLRVIFKDEDTLHRGSFRYGDGREVNMVTDSYLHEIAAYELDLMLGLEIVAPCVERKLYGRKGSLCLWLEDTMTEAERNKRDIEPPDRRQWNQQMLTARLFQQLISDQDYSNTRNIIVDSNFRIYKIDSSMAFYHDPQLIDQLNPSVYPRTFLAALESLDNGQLEERLRPWLIKAQTKSLWERRNRILKRAEKLISERGEDAVLY